MIHEHTYLDTLKVIAYNIKSLPGILQSSIFVGLCDNSPVAPHVCPISTCNYVLRFGRINGEAHVLSRHEGTMGDQAIINRKSLVS